MTKSRKKMKGVINLVEMITVLIIIFVAFGVFFPGFVYKNRWNEAYTTLISRDTILSIDRIGKLYNYSFNPNNLQAYLSTALPINQSNLISWSQVDGAVKNNFIIACNCTDSQVTILSGWLDGLTFNGRQVNVLILKTNLESIAQPSDVLLIWGFQNLSPYQQQINNYIKAERGVVEVMQFTDVSQVNTNPTQQHIFGLFADSLDTATQKTDSFPRNPTNSSDIFYGTYKYFYHLPVPLKTFPNLTSAVPNDIPISDCPNFYQTNITFNSTTYNIWDCSISVYFDTNNNGNADKEVFVGNNLTINGISLYLNYVNGLDQVGISFKPNFTFSDFSKINPTQIMNMTPINNDTSRVVLASNPLNYSVVILNQSGVSKAAWINFFPESGSGDDQKQLLTSILIWASNKGATNVLISSNQVGFLTSYINTANQDIFEVYRFNLGLGSPFGQ